MSALRTMAMFYMAPRTHALRRQINSALRWAKLFTFRHQLLHQYFESHLSQQLKNIVKNKKKKLALIITCTLKPKGRNKRRSILDDRSLSSEFLANHSPVSRICFSTGPSNIPLKSGNIPLYVIFSWSKSLLISKLTFSGNKSSYL